MDDLGAGPPYDQDLMVAVTELGEALRALVDASVTTAVPAAELRSVAAGAGELTSRLAAARRAQDELSPLDDPMVLRRVYNPVIGVGSALAVPLVVREAEGGVLAEASFGTAYEGPPGALHGGVSGLLMDQMVGSASKAAGLMVFTVRLELDYRAAVPLHTPLVLTARIGELSGRKATATGAIALAAQPDRPLVEAAGVLVMPRGLAEQPPAAR